MFTAIGTMFLISSFSMLSCTVNRLSDQDRKWLTNEIEMGALESKNTRLRKENTELKKKMKDLKECVGRLEKENTTVKKENEDLRKKNTELIKVNRSLKDEDDLSLLSQKTHNKIKPTKSLEPDPDKIFHVGDYLPSFSSDVLYIGPISWFAGDVMIHGIKEGPHIHFQKKGSGIELKNGTRYICATPKGCKVDLTNFAVTEGKIEVYYNKE